MATTTDTRGLNYRPGGKLLWIEEGKNTSFPRRIIGKARGIKGELGSTLGQGGQEALDNGLSLRKF